MATTSERRRSYRGPALLAHGFRPFFLLAGIWAALAMLLWVMVLAAGGTIPSRLEGVDWHMHEMLFGYTSAVVAGFLMTAVPNWTGRMPVVGWPVAALAGVWLAGRAAILVSAWLPPLVAPLVDIGFLVLLGAVIAREIIAGRNWRNLKILVLVLLLAAANAVFHAEALTGGALDGYGIRMGVGVIVMLISLIGGRVTPSFTRNWLAKRGAARPPAPFGRADAVALAIGGAAILAWVVAPEFAAFRPLFLLAALAHTVRLARWQGHRSLAEPLVTILHVGYAFVPLGFLALGAGDLLPGGPIPPHVPHAWTAGAVGVMTLAMMTRASLGHGGRPLTATGPIVAIYAAVVLAAALRILAEFLPSEFTLLYASAALWIAGFAGFGVVFLPVLATARK